MAEKFLSINRQQEKENEMEVVFTRVWKIWRDDNDIVHSQFLPDNEQTLEDAKEFIAALEKFCPDKKSAGIVDIRNVKKTNPEIRAYFAREGKNIGVACAILVGSPMSSIIGNFFLKINRPDFPAKNFYSEALAIKWLKEFNQ